MGEGANILIGGTERVVLELEIDLSTGALLAGRSLEDELDVTLWIPFAAVKVPDRWPKQRGRQITSTRELSLKRIN